jgi:hypothetical protein
MHFLLGFGTAQFSRVWEGTQEGDGPKQKKHSNSPFPELHPQESLHRSSRDSSLEISGRRA